MKLTDVATKQIIRRLFDGDDYRTEVLALINAVFLQHVIDFFQEIVSLKLHGKDLTNDWYKRHFLGSELDKADIGVHAGLNMKSINNAYGTTAKSVVINVSMEHYDELKSLINQLIEAGEDIDIQLTIKFRSVSFDLNLSETLIVINALAVKRAQIRGGLWSTAGKQTELPFMVTLAKLYNVPPKNYDLKGITDEGREVDFHFVHDNGNRHFCEFKLMGKGNPESADVAIARQTNIFIADTLSQTNKNQLDGLGVHWVELRSDVGFRKLFDILQILGIPCHNYQGDLNALLDDLVGQAFEEINRRGNV